MTDRLGNIPRYAIFRGRKVRIIDYDEDKFTVIDHEDARRILTRGQLKFLPEKKKS